MCSHSEDKLATVLVSIELMTDGYYRLTSLSWPDDDLADVISGRYDGVALGEALDALAADCSAFFRDPR